MSETPLTPEPGAGAILKQTRAQHGLSVGDIAGQLKYAPRQIEALEAEEFARLPGATFVRGMIRGYAKLLKIEAQPLLDNFARSSGPSQVSVELHSESIPFPQGHKRGTSVYLALSVLLLFAVAGILYEWQFGAASMYGAQAGGGTALVTQREPAPDTSPALPVPPAAPQPVQVQSGPMTMASAASLPPALPQAPDSARGGMKRIVLEFDKDSWVQVKGSTGRILLSQLNPAGSQRVVEGTPPFTLVIGNAAGVRLRYDDSPVDLKPYVNVEVARLTLE